MQEKIQEIAARIHELRELSDMTVGDVASKLGIDQSVYEAYEKGEKDMPVSLLLEIAELFKVDSTALLTGQEARLHFFSVTRAGKGISVERRKQYNYEALATSFIAKKADPFIVTVEPKPEDTTVKTASHPGQEFNYILEGRLKVFIHSNEIILEKGDSIYFDSTCDHAMQALDGKKAVFLAFVI
ncbi:MAG: helix-turn-helix domain-containing protein [Sedimentisphaeraceae bacterium JB056]